VATSNGHIDLTFAEERETKGTFRFAEVLADDLDEPKIGTLYVRKSTLRNLGWERGHTLSVSVTTK